MSNIRLLFGAWKYKRGGAAVTSDTLKSAAEQKQSHPGIMAVVCCLFLRCLFPQFFEIVGIGFHHFPALRQKLHLVIKRFGCILFQSM